MRKRLIISLVIVGIFITYFSRVFYVNFTSNKIDKISYEKGKTVQNKDYLYTLKSTKILNVDQLNSEYKLNIANSLYDIDYVVAEIEVEYIGDKESAPCLLANTSFQSGAWHNGQAMDAFYQINGNSIKLEKGKKYTLYTTGMLSKIMFLDKDWKKLNDMKFELVLSTYPQEIVLECN